MWSIAEVQYSSLGLNQTQIIITLYAADFLMTLIYWGEKDLTPKQQMIVIVQVQFRSE